ncbi:MAG TPA: hypothetical protein VK509_18080 [Polyangiales bacterium]|nr:hypothetical protein [Polyangiales bacterium]
MRIAQRIDPRAAGRERCALNAAACGGLAIGGTADQRDHSRKEDDSAPLRGQTSARHEAAFPD